MMAGVVAGQARLLAPVSAALWTPLNMAVVPQIYLDVQDSVVTDVSGVCSAISNLGAMGANGDFSQATAGSRPTILSGELSGKRVLRFDGLDDVMQGGSTQQLALLRNVSVAWVFCVYKKRLLDTTGARIVFAVPRGGSAGTRFSIAASSDAALNRPDVNGRRLDDGLYAAMSHGSAPVGYVMTFSGINYATRAGQIRMNGDIGVENAALMDTAGTTSNTPSFSPLCLGGVNTAGVAASDIDLAAIIVSSVYPSSADVDKLFGWAAHKYGLTTNLPGGHPYKTVAPTA